MKTLSDQALLTELKSESNNSFELLYKAYFPSTAHYIRQNSGQSHDAEDVFQEAIVVLLHKVRSPDFVLTSSLKTYLYAIAKNIWLKRLRDVKPHSIQEEFADHDAERDLYYEDPVATMDKKQVDSWLEKVSARCQEIIKAIFFSQEPMEKLMKRMGWKNKHTAANQKYKCIEQVKKESKKPASI
ncbi:MAG: sigma-70 family RNA polymerase sigma factor [Fibrobacteria bacterium]